MLDIILLKTEVAFSLQSSQEKGILEDGCLRQSVKGSKVLSARVEFFGSSFIRWIILAFHE